MLTNLHNTIFDSLPVSSLLLMGSPRYAAVQGTTGCFGSSPRDLSMPSPAEPTKHTRARIGLVGPTTLAIEFAQAKVSVVIGNCSPITFPKMHLTRTVDVRYVS